jgi:hypothetical protein
MEMSSGTVSYHLKVLAPAIVSRRPLTFNLAALGVAGSEPAIARREEARGKGEGSDQVEVLVSAVASLHATVAALMEMVTRLLVTAPGVHVSVPSSAASEADDRARLVRASARGVRANARVVRASVQSDRTELPAQTYSLTDQNARGSARGVREDFRAPAVSDDELDELLAPLIGLCDRLHLVGVTNRSRLRLALEPYQRDQVAHAIGVLARQVRAGAPIRSPIGLLVRLAEQHDVNYFSSRPKPDPGGDRPDPDRGVTPEEPPAVELSNEQVERLDREINESLDRLPPSVRHRLLGDGEAMHRLRMALLADAAHTAS